MTSDTNLFISDKNVGTLFQQMNKELKNISTWFKANKLSINIGKTKWTTFYPTFKKRFMSKKFPELFIDGITLKGTVTKFLGVFIDENVTWKAYINTISTKISKSIGILYIARLIIPRKQLSLYCQQKHSIRLLSFKDQFILSRPLLKEICALNIYEINIFNILCLMFKCKNKVCPKAFENYLL